MLKVIYRNELHNIREHMRMSYRYKWWYAEKEKKSITVIRT